MINSVKNQIKDHQNIIVGYSGGVDSTVLLHILKSLQKTLNLNITAVHVHHGISLYANEWATHCKSICDAWQIPFFAEYVSIDKNSGNIEDKARRARYSALSKHLTPNSALCTAQHLDDQSETFLLALKRGSGLSGLSSMPKIIKKSTDDFTFFHLRPLLDISKAQIEQYAQEHQLKTIEDESNQDTHFDRNFLRLDVLPILTGRWPHFNQMVARSALICQEQQNLIESLLAEQFNQMLGHDLSLDISSLQSDHNQTKTNAFLRLWLKKLQIKMPSKKQLAQIWQDVLMAKEDKNPKFIIEHHQIRRYKNRLFLLPLYQNTADYKLDWDLNSDLKLPDEIGFLSKTTATPKCRLPLDTEAVSVRFNAFGEFNIVGRAKSRQIKKIWQEQNIAPWNRTRIPLIFYNDTLITAVGVFVTEQGKGDEINFIITNKIIFNTIKRYLND